MTLFAHKGRCPRCGSDPAGDAAFREALSAQQTATQAPAPGAEPVPSYRRDYPTSEKVLGVEHEKAREDERLYGVGFTVNGWHVPAPVVACWGMENKRENEKRYAALAAQAPAVKAELTDEQIEAGRPEFCEPAAFAAGARFAARHYGTSVVPVQGSQS